MTRMTNLQSGGAVFRPVDQRQIIGIGPLHRSERVAHPQIAGVGAGRHAGQDQGRRARGALLSHSMRADYATSAAAQRPMAEVMH